MKLPELKNISDIKNSLSCTYLIADQILQGKKKDQWAFRQEAEREQKIEKIAYNINSEDNLNQSNICVIGVTQRQA